MNTTILPTAFLERLKLILTPEDYLQALRRMQDPEWVTVRINTLKADPALIITELQRQFNIQLVSWLPYALAIPCTEQTKLMATEAYQQGHLYLQNLASMLPPIILAPKPDDLVLDLTAAPGSKTSQLAQIMQNQGQIIAVEAVKSRFYRLKSNLAQLGVSNTSCLLRDGSQLWRTHRNRFDKVLLDAPCSSEARFSLTDSATFQFWSEKKVLEMQRKQKKLLYSAAQCCQLGGSIIYATCSYAPEENECVISRFVERFHNAVAIEPLTLNFPNQRPGLTKWQSKPLHPDLKYALRIIPDELMHGFFICKIKKFNMLQ